MSAPAPRPAEALPYWQTSKISPDTWIDKAKREISRAGGKVLAEGFGADATGRSAFMLGFEIQGDRFRLTWPVTRSRSGLVASERIQAATMLFYDVKSRCVASRVLGSRVAFFSYLVLPDGRSAAELAVPDLAKAFPALLSRGGDE